MGRYKKRAQLFGALCPTYLLKLHKIPYGIIQHTYILHQILKITSGSCYHPEQLVINFAPISIRYSIFRPLLFNIFASYFLQTLK